VLPDLSLFNITLTPTLRDEIIAAQKTDEIWVILREESKKETQKSLVSMRMWKVVRFQGRLVVPKRETLKKNS
jgi:hypothetical protein